MLASILIGGTSGLLINVKNLEMGSQVKLNTVKNMWSSKHTLEISSPVVWTKYKNLERLSP